MLAVLGLASTAHAQQPVDLEPFLKKDVITDIKISPTGEHYALTVPMEDRTVLAIARRSDMEFTAKIQGDKHSTIADFWWVNDDRVVVSTAQKFGSEDQPHLTGDLYAVNADGSRMKVLFDGQGADSALSQQAAFMVDTLANDDRSVLVSIMVVGDEPLTRVEKLDVYSGNRSTVATAPVRRARFATDAAGNVRFAQGAGSDNVSKLYYRADNAAEWRLLNDEGKSGHIEWPLGFSGDGSKAYLQAEKSDGPDAIIEIDIATDARTERLRDVVVDPYAPIYNHDGRVPAGAFFMHKRIGTRFLDEQSATARLYRKLEKAFPGQAVAVTSVTEDGRLLLVKAWSDRNPGDFLLFDTVTNNAALIFSRRSWFDPDKMSPTHAIAFKARDGLALHGYLTVPLNAKAEKLPMVVIPHGGPFGLFDAWEFDDEAQMLSKAGYAVLRVNFRGSGNYGRTFTHAGARQWGRAMQDDVTDATHWAIAENIADPGRICLYGASYGGYASLMGVAKEPDAYRCAVGYVGVYDLALMHKEDSAESESMRRWVEDWVGERSSLEQVSPTHLASRIKVPIFLAAGGEDEIAPIAHSKRMEKALKAAGVPVETLYFDTEGHGFYTEPHRREFYGKLLDFLQRHLSGSPNAQP